MTRRYSRPPRRGLRPTVHRLDLTNHVALFIEEQEKVVLVSAFGPCILTFDELQQGIEKCRRERDAAGQTGSKP